MYLPVCFQFLLLVMLQSLGKGTSYEYNRTIFVSQNGTLNDSCWSEVSPEWPCASLDLALQGAETLSGFVKILIDIEERVGESSGVGWDRVKTT